MHAIEEERPTHTNTHLKKRRPYCLHRYWSLLIEIYIFMIGNSDENLIETKIVMVKRT